jgi:hypothetical protein
MKTTTKSRQLTSGNTLSTLTLENNENGWRVTRWESWKGQEPSQVELSGSTWRNTETEANEDLERTASEMRENGWN